MTKSRARDRKISFGDLSEHLGYVLRRAQMAAFQHFIDALRPVDLTPGKFSVLFLIGENPGLPQSAIAEALGIQKGNFVALLHEFEKRGLAERRASGKDGRTKALHLTPKGRALLRRAHALSKAHEAGLADALGPQAQAQLRHLLLELERIALAMTSSD